MFYEQVPTWRLGLIYGVGFIPPVTVVSWGRQGSSEAISHPKPQWFGITLPNYFFQAVFITIKTMVATLFEKADFQIVLFYFIFWFVPFLDGVVSIFDGV